MEITEFEKKRAANLIWNSAHDYTIETGFRVYDADGKADVYWNSIVGAIHLHYDWKKLLAFYNTFHEKINQEVYESLFWRMLSMRRRRSCGLFFLTFGSSMQETS